MQLGGLCAGGGCGLYVGVRVLPTPDGAGRACGEPGGVADSRPQAVILALEGVCWERNSPPS